MRKSGWIEDALVCGWATGWASSPLRWRRWSVPKRAVVVVLFSVAAAVVVPRLVAAIESQDLVILAATRAHHLLIACGVSLGILLLAHWLPFVGAVAVSRALGRRPGRRGDRTHGTAEWHPLKREWWNPRDAVAAAVVLQRQTREARDGLVPSTVRDARFAHFTWAQLSRHMLVVGATGSGKTTSVFHHLMLSSRVPWIYQDQKAELPLFDRFPERPVWGLDTRGYRTRSGVWNPMDEVRGPEDIEVMSALLFPDKGNMNDWIVRGARMLFEAMCKRWRFSSLQEYVYLIEHTPLERIVAELPRGYATALADARARAYYVSEILDVLRPWINTARIAAVTFGPSTVTLDDFMNRGGYVLCNEDKHLRQPVTLFWGLLLHRLRNRSNVGASPLLLLLDELADAGRIPNLAQALALYRSKSVGIVAGVQSFALMESIYGESEWRAVRDGFGTHIVLTANITPQLQVELSEQLGSFTMLHPQSSIGLGWPRPSVHVGVASPSRVASPLVPIDQWSQWSAARAAIVRGAAGPTWWIPCPVEIALSPTGEPLLGEHRDDWRLSEAQRIAALGSVVRGELPAPAARQPLIEVAAEGPGLERVVLP